MLEAEFGIIEDIESRHSRRSSKSKVVSEVSK